jgi:hypothetical protein
VLSFDLSGNPGDRPENGLPQIKRLLTPFANSYGALIDNLEAASPVPEPATILLRATGLVVLATPNRARLI